MGREVKVNEAITDQFPVFEADGYTKKSGETAFTASFWRNGVSQSVSYTISEIGTSGEYRLQFTPNSDGFWFAEVKVPYNESVWGGEYYVVDGVYSLGASMSDDGLLSTFLLWIDEVGQRVDDWDSISAKVRDKDGNEIVDLGTNNSPVLGVFEFQNASIDFAHAVAYWIDVIATKGTLTIPMSVGFSRF